MVTRATSKHRPRPLARCTDGWDPDGHWVETQVLSGTIHDETTLRVTLVRTVNNLQLPRTEQSASFTQITEGSLKRVAGP